MKKIIAFALCAVICFSFLIPSYAADSSENQSAPPEVSQDASHPRLMVSSYTLSSDSLTPSEKSILKISVKNYSSSKAVSNIKLSLQDESGDITAAGTATKYVSKINANGTYVWELELRAAKAAAIGEHNVTIAMEYEDKYFTPYTNTDVIKVSVKQSTAMDYTGVQLPVKVYQDGTVTMDVTIMNTGKSKISNCKLTFDIEALNNGGALFIGEIEPGQSSPGSTNLRVSASKLGQTAGTVTIYYENEFGDSFEKKIDVSTNIQKKIVKTEETDEKEEQKNTLWWLFVLIGLSVGGVIGFAVPTAINTGKKRREDELRL